MSEGKGSKREREREDHRIAHFGIGEVQLLTMYS